jgi:beta-xylosidase
MKSTRAVSVYRHPVIISIAMLAFICASCNTEPPVRSKQAIQDTYDCFVPGAVWEDPNGTPINAHGGGILIHGDTYYWFGEHKVAGKKGNAAHVGVRCYSSRDLYHWTDEGIALSVSHDPESDIAAGCILERPKVIHNKKTGRFVMWFHLEPKGTGYKAARSGVAVSDSVTGPYTYLRSFRPNAGVWPENLDEPFRTPLPENELKDDVFSGGPDERIQNCNVLRRDFKGGQMARDMTLFVDDDGQAYHLYASEENGTLHISLLTDDYLAPAGRYVRVFENRWMEAPAICKREGKYYMLMSGCTGWAPNAARSAVAESIWGPWKELGNPCIGNGNDSTFGGQSTYIVKFNDQPDAYIALFDQWRPENAIDGRYLWLPMNFTDDGFEIHFRNQWDLSYFNQ